MINSKNSKIQSLFTAFALLIVFGVLSNVIISWAWLTFVGGGAFEPQYSNYTVSSTVFFGSTSSDAFTNADNRLISVDVTDKDAVNYIENMKIDVSYQGKSMAYLRVKLTDEWTAEDPDFPDNRQVLSNTAQIRYDVQDPNWIDMRKIDGYFYYALPLGGKTDDLGVVDDTAVVLTLLDGIVPGMYIPDQEYTSLDLQMRLSVKVEAVQVNRIKAFWGEYPSSIVTPYK